MNKSVVIYHAKCPDGFGAAWAFWKKFGENADYIPMQHGENPPDLTDKDVYIADFSFKKDILIDISKKAKSIIVLDHHKTAQQNCEGLDFCTFDMNHSGAVLAWKFCFPEVETPLLLRYIEDRDLWRWNMPSSEAILSFVDSNEMSFSRWTELDCALDKIHSKKWSSIRESGFSILNYKNSLIHNLISNSYRINFHEFNIPVINISFFQSEIASNLSVGEPFAAAYYYDGTVYRFSLRSSEGGEDVALIAQRFDGGGGHKRAAGFSIRNLQDLENKYVTRYRESD